MKQAKKIIESVKDSEIFQQAFTHSSYKNQLQLNKSYETLEFLGDSILNFATSLFLYLKFPDFNEGQMSKLKQLMVRENTLAYLTKKFELHNFIKLGSVEKKNNGNNKVSILADVFESFIAALYLEKGEKKVFEFLKITLFDWVKNKESLVWDYKSQLQEFCQAKKNKIIYEVKSIKKKGSEQIFNIEVSDELNTFKEFGLGKSKKNAEQEAAKKVIKKLKILEKEENLLANEKISIGKKEIRTKKKKINDEKKNHQKKGKV